MIVPKDLRKFVGKTELRYTLKTGYLGVAKHKARLIAGQVQLIFRYLRKGDRVLSKLSDGQIRKLMWFKRNGHFAKVENNESEVSNERSKSPTALHGRV